MGERTRLGKSYAGWGIVLPVIMALLFGVPVAFALAYGTVREPWVAYLLLGFAAFFILMAIVVGITISRTRMWLEITDDGFVITDGKGVHRHKDEDVCGMANWKRDKFSGGILKSTTQYLRLWFDAGGMQEQSGLMMHKAKVGREEPLAKLRDRVFPKLVQRSKADLEAGKTITGDGWELRRNEFYLSLPRQTESVAVDHIGAAGSWGNQLCVWKKGQDQPFVRFSPDCRNYHLLGAMLDHLVSGRTDTEQRPAGSLGRVLFQRHRTNWLSVLIVIGSIAGALALAAGLEVYIPAAVLIVGGLIAAFIVGKTHPCSFQCHERGVHHVGVFGEKLIRYDEVASFSYGATRQFVNGVYSGTFLNLAFVRDPGLGGGSIMFSEKVSGQDEDLDKLRDHISGVIAARMAGDFSQGRSVQWTRNLRFVPDGLEYSPAGLFGRKAMVHVPFADMGGFYLHDGKFHLKGGPEGKVLIVEQVSEPNFFPGFAMLGLILAPPEGQQQAQQ
jgi:hypothetical protein